MSWGAKLEGYEQLAPEMQAAAHEGVQSGLELLGLKGEEMVVGNIRTPYDGRPAAVCFGILAGAITSHFEPLGETAREIIGVKPTVKADEYAAPVETGAAAHMPPVSALVPWVQKKFDVEDEKHALSIAWAVAKKIAKRGTRGHQMFNRALTALEPMAPEALEKEIALAFARHGFVGVTG
jgi:hypothetical protein